jgi:hypothetical protein
MLYRHLPSLALLWDTYDAEIDRQLSIDESQCNPATDNCAEFKKYLIDIQCDPHPDFDLLFFKSCSDDERNQCAQDLVDYAVTFPRFAVKYAELALKIQMKCVL